MVLAHPELWLQRCNRADDVALGMVVPSSVAHSFPNRHIRCQPNRPVVGSRRLMVLEDDGEAPHRRGRLIGIEEQSVLHIVDRSLQQQEIDHHRAGFQCGRQPAIPVCLALILVEEGSAAVPAPGVDQR